MPLAISGTGVSADGYTLSVTSGTGAALFGANTLTPNLCFSGAGAQTATLALRPMATSTVERYRIALGPDGDGANGFDRVVLGTNVGSGADPHGTQSSFHVWKDLGHPSVTITGGATVTTGSEVTFTLTVDVTDSGDFATTGQNGSRTVSIRTDGRGSLTVTTVDDSTFESHGMIEAILQSGLGYKVASPSRDTVYVNDNDDDGSGISVSGPTQVTEGQEFELVTQIEQKQEKPQPLRPL